MVRLLSTLLRAVSLSLCIRSVVATPVPSIYIIEISDDQTDIEAVIKDISTVCEAANVQTNVRFIYDSGPIIGFSFTISGGAADTLADHQLQARSGVKNIWTFPRGHHELKRDAIVPSSQHFVQDISPATLPDPEQLLPRQDNSSGTWRPHQMTGIDKLHAAGIKGKGTRVAMIDMCWDVSQEALGGSIGADKKITYAYNWRTSTETDVQCTCDSHGTACLGILAANPTKYNIVGVAPEASIELHSVYSCDDTNLEDDYLYNVVRQVAARGVDVISFSLNEYTSRWPNAFSSVIFSRIQENGTFIATSVGNGRGRAFSILPPASGNGVPAVGMVNDAQVQYTYWNGSYSTDGVEAGRAPYIPAQVGYGGPSFPRKSESLVSWSIFRFRDKILLGLLQHLVQPHASKHQ